MKVIINNKITLSDVPQDLLTELKSRLYFLNPKFEENEKRGYSNWETPQILKFYEIVNGNLTLPRGFARQLLSLCRREDVTFHIEDNRRTLAEVSFSFRGKLRPYQEDAVMAILRRDFGVLSSPSGSGKTVMCFSTIAERRQPALVICHTRELQLQWAARIEQFLGIPKEQVGIIGGGQKKIGSKITVALIQSLYKVTSEVSPYIGHVIIDECHRCPSRTFIQAVSCFDSKYMLGLSATPWRRDGLSKLIYWTLGDISHEIKKEDLIETGDVLQAEVIVRETDFDTLLDPSEEYSKMLSELTQDPERNALIAYDIAKEANNGGGICLVLSDRKAHCETFKALLSDHGVKAEVLTGDISNKDREAIVDQLNNGHIKVLIATGQLIGEGFDCKGLSTLFLTTPIKFSGRVIQYLGRVLRPAPGKDKAKVYDYIDHRVGVLRAAAKARQKVYING